MITMNLVIIKIMDFLVDIDPMFLLGLVVFLGYFSILIFEKKRISQIITLVIVGLIIGPLLGIIDTSVDSVIMKTSPFLAALALILLLFDGGLNLNIVRTAKEFPKSILFTIIVFVLSTIFTGFFMEKFLNWDFIYGALLGAILGGTSSAVIITVVEKSKVGSDIKTFLTLESTITDVLVVITSSILISFIVGGNLDLNTALILLTSAFSTSILFGAIFALVWIYLLNKLEDKSFSYMLTISFALVLYSVSNLLGGNGNFTVFIFALVLGNIKLIQNYFKHSFFEDLALNKRIKSFQEEMTFFIRTFFFVYMGIIIPINYLLSPFIISVVIMLTLIYLTIRFFVVRLFVKDARRDEKFLVTTSMGRGLAAAVVASIAISKGVSVPGFVEIIIGVILLTNILTTWGLYQHYEYIKKREEEKEQQKEEKTNNKRNNRNNKKSALKNNGKKRATSKKEESFFIDWIF